MKYDKIKGEIKLNRKLSNLDKLVLEFTDILKKHVKYVIISGYISILLGRARATEDVDLFIEKINIEKFTKLYVDLDKAGFWCLNAEKLEEVFSYLEDGLAVRFARKGKSIPNFEVKFPKDEIDKGTFDDAIKVSLDGKEILISSLERQVAFKRYFLKSEKDIEDALHIEEIFKQDLDHDKINKLRKLIENRENG